MKIISVILIIIISSFSWYNFLTGENIKAIYLILIVIALKIEIKNNLLK